MLLSAFSRRAMTACAVALAATVVFSGPATAAAATPAAGCPVVPTVQPFGPWQDFADYFLAPDGDIEAGATSWDLEGGAAAVEGNQPFRVGDPGDHMSLRLPAGSSATTAALCIASEHRTMRFFARGSGGGVLQVHAVYAKRTSKQSRVHLGSIVADGSWAPSPIIPMVVNELASERGGALTVSLRFTPRGSATWQIDDVYVDPYRRG